MPIEQVDVGEPVELAAFFIGADGSPVNPTTIVLLITLPDGSTITKAKADCTNPTTGDFRYTQTATLEGVWTHKWTPSNGAIQEEFFLVGKSASDGPCDAWIGPQDLFDCAPLSAVAESDRDYGMAANAAAAASRLLYAMSGSRYPGICKTTIRPCTRQWPWGACSCGATSHHACRCGGGTISELLLSPDFPVLGIQQVRIDGTVLASTSYRVDDDHWLVRTDGDPWPANNDLALAATEVGTWDVVFFVGRVAPPDGIIGAVALAVELYQGCQGGECALPPNVRSKVYQGTELTFIEPGDFADGETGVRQADRFLQAVRVGDAEQRTTVASPDLVAGYRRTAT